MINTEFLFRFHRGSLEDSMNTVREIASYNHLLKIINDDWKSWGVELEKIDIKPYVYDERIGWDTHIVLATEKESGKTYPIGFLNQKLEI